MAFSSLLKVSLLKGPALKSLANQALRTSSICTQFNITSNKSNNNSLVNGIKKNQFLTPSLKSSQILAKYFNTTRTLQSADGKGHDHVGIWKLERALSIALLPLVPAALIAPSPVLDTIVATIIVMHTHWGLEAIVVDYIRPILFGDIGPKIGMALLYIFSAVTLAGCLNVIYNDIGLANTILAIWKL